MQCRNGYQWMYCLGEHVSSQILLSHAHSQWFSHKEHDPRNWLWSYQPSSHEWVCVLVNNMCDMQGSFHKLNATDCVVHTHVAPRPHLSSCPPPSLSTNRQRRREAPPAATLYLWYKRCKEKQSQFQYCSDYRKRIRSLYEHGSAQGTLLLLSCVQGWRTDCAGSWSTYPLTVIGTERRAMSLIGLMSRYKYHGQVGFVSHRSVK